MADKNLARSGPADIDLLSEDDPLAELARIVGYEPRNVPTVARPVPPEPLQEPAFDLESELLREFARYDAPALDPVADVEADRDVAFDGATLVSPDEAAVEPAQALESVAEISDRNSSWNAASPDEAAATPIVPDWNALQVTAEPEVHLPAMEAASFPEPERPAIVAPMLANATGAPSDEPVFLGLQPAEFSEPAAEPAALDLDRELELSLGDVFADVADEPRTEASIQRSEPLQQPDADAFYDAAAAGMTIAATGNAHTGVLNASIVEALPAVEASYADAGLSSAYAEPVVVDPAIGDGAHFDVAELPVEVASVGFVPAWMPEAQAEAPLAAVDDALATSSPDANAAFQSDPSYEIAPAVRATSGLDLDELLAEVERFPVPESRPPVAVPLEAPRTRPGSLDGFSSVKFGRATPVAFNRQQPSAPPPSPPVAVPAPLVEVEPTVAPPAEMYDAKVSVATALPLTPQRAGPVIDRAADEVENAFANFELDLSDIELKLDASDLTLGEAVAAVAPPVAHQPAPVFTPAPRAAVVDGAFAQPPQAARPAQPTKYEPVVAAVPAQEPEDIDIALPFDPSLIAETDTSVAPVAELDVPQLPAIEKEKPPVRQPEYDIDIDAEMAQLFTDPAGNAGYARGLDRASAAPVAASPKAGSGESDEFDKALEEDLRRSLSQPERHAIPLDAQQVGDDFVGDGYDEPARRGRGLMIAAAAATLVVLGGAGVYAYLGGSTDGAGAGEPRVILANKEPTKIVPEEKGGKTVPNQDKAVYDRVAGASDASPQQEQLVTSTEEPVDVVQRTLAPEMLPFDGPEDDLPVTEPEGAAATGDDRLLPGVDESADADPAKQDGKAPVVSPRKVRTMIVKPDGTLVAREEPVVETESALAETASASAAVGAEAGLRAEQTGGATVVMNENERALQEAAKASVEDSAPVRVVRTTAVGAPADAAAQTTASQPAGTTNNGAPVPVTRPADQPVDVVGTVTERGRVTDAKPTETAALSPEANQQPAAEQVPAAAANPGGYVIQIASLPSEEEANKSYNSLSAKFSGVIGGRGVDIKRADIPNKGTYFRVRIPAGSREEANALCSKYKSAGGSCLVTK